MILSRILNQYLYLTLKRCCKDPATGFVLTKKVHLTSNPLKGSYGDYCPRFLFESRKAKIRIVEIPYICLPRKHGESKTGSNLAQLIKRGLPYVVMPLKIRFSR
jgi:dolichol-phosphate mannosyltransferase